MTSSDAVEDKTTSLTSYVGFSSQSSETSKLASGKVSPSRPLMSMAHVDGTSQPFQPDNTVGAVSSTMFNLWVAEEALPQASVAVKVRSML